MAPRDDETARCPLGFRCESCGSTGPALAVRVVPVLGERICLTLCPGCAAADRPPAIMLSTAVRLAAQHREHLRPVELRRVLPLRADDTGA